MRYVAEKDLEKCRQCGFCDKVACSSRYVGYSEECTGCGACSLACPYETIQMIEIQNGKSISITVDGGFQFRRELLSKKRLRCAAMNRVIFQEMEISSPPAGPVDAGAVRFS